MSRLIEKLDDEEKLLPSDDGYCVYWAEGGYMTAENLREIADELDRRNKTWHKQVMQDVGIPMPQIKPLVWVAGNPRIDEWTAETPLGKFRILRRFAESTVSIYMAPFTWDPRNHFGTINEAKRICQSEYERRVRECLEW